MTTTADAPLPSRVWRVLVVNGDAVDRAELRGLLLQGSERRLEFAEAETGGAAVRAVLGDPGGPPDCVLLDYNLPDANAADVLAALARPDGYAVCPVVVLSGDESSAQGQTVLRAGAQDYLGKRRLGAAGLNRAVENAAERHRAALALARRVERQSLLLQVTRLVLADRRDEPAIVAAAFELVAAHLRVDVGLFYRLGHDGRLHLAWQGGAADAARARTVAGAPRGPAFEAGPPLIAEPTREGAADREASARANGVRAYVAHSLTAADGRPIGDLAFASTLVDAFTLDEVHFFEEMCHSLAVTFGRHRAEAEARAAAEFNRSLMDGSADCVKVMDLEGRLLHMNAPGQCLLEVDDFGSLCGLEWPALWPAEARDGVRAAVVGARAGAVSTFRAPCPTAQGTPRWWDVTVSPVRESPGGPVVRLLAVSRDVTAARRAEAELRASEARLRLAVGAAELATWDWDVAADRVTWSRELAARQGIEPGAAPATLADVVAMIHVDDRDRVRAAVAASVAAGDRYECEFRMVRPDGGERWVVGMGRVVRDESARAMRLIGVELDVTTRRRAEEKLRENELRLRLALEGAGVGMWEWDPRSDAVSWSAECYAIHGLGPGEFDGTGQGFGRLVHPEDAPRVWSTVRGAMSAGTPYGCEFRIVRPDGTVRWVTNRGRASYDGAGRPTRMVGILADVTDQKSAALALAGRERELRSITDNVPDIIARFDRGLRHVFVNAAATRATGLPTRAFLGKTNRELGMPPALCTEWDAGLRGVFDSGTARQLGFSFDAPDGTRRYEARLVPEPGPDGQVGHVVAITRDVTASWRAAAELGLAKDAAERANAAKDHFLAVLSHELRTPLAPVRMAISVWERDPGALPADFRDDLAMIRRNVELECRLIDDMLDLNRIARGKLDLQFDPVDLHGEVRHAVRTCEGEATEKRIALSLDARASHAAVVGDAARLQQVLWNLLKNAVKFTPPGGSVGVRTSNPTPAQVRVEVIDTGAGIEPDVIDGIFRAFEQGGVHVTRQFGGLGLGLAISKRLVEMHGGTLTAYSEGRGRGATFTLDMATAERSATDRVAGSGAASITGPGRDVSAARNGRALRILLVEDHVDTARLMKRLLGRLGHEVDTAGSIAEALATSSSRAAPFDLLISDIGLPDGSGCDLLRELRARGPLPAIALSGYGMSEDVLRGRAAGFAAHLTKPVSLEQLEVTIQRVADAARGGPRA